METKNLNTKYCVGLGEILFDVLPSGSQLGGAPVNFAYLSHLRLQNASRADQRGKRSWQEHHRVENQ